MSSRFIGPNRRLTAALESLSNVADVFDELDLNEAAEATTALLENVSAFIEKSAAAKKKPKKKTPAKKSKPAKKKTVKPSLIVIEEDPFTKNLNSTKQLENLKHFGWPFNEPEILVKQDNEDCMEADDFSWIDDIDNDYNWVEEDKNYNYDSYDNQETDDWLAY